AVERDETRERAHLRDRIHSVAREWQSEPAESLAPEPLMVIARRRHQHHLPSAALQLERERQAEIPQVPIGIGEEQGLQARASPIPASAATCEGPDSLTPSSHCLITSAAMRRRSRSGGACPRAVYTARIPSGTW